MHDFHDLLMNAPMLITVQHGEDLRLDLFNLQARKAIGGRDLTGKTLAEAFPELKDWLRRVAAVVRIGQPYVGVDEAVTLDWSGTGELETRFLTFVCQPLLGKNGVFDGVVTFAIDVTASVLAREGRGRDGPPLAHPVRGRSARLLRGNGSGHQDVSVGDRSLVLRRVAPEAYRARASRGRDCP
jgi:hypothetical protein